MFRNASIKDLGFICQLVVDGAQEGHFQPVFARSREAQEGLMLNLRSVLVNKQRLDVDATAYALVYENGGAPRAFLAISAVSKREGTEIWMAAVAREHRGVGYGGALIDAVLDEIDKDPSPVLARCAPASERMFQMLLRRGFRHADTGNEGTRVLLRLGRQQ